MLRDAVISEIVNGLKNLFDKRNQKRRELFLTDIDPMMDLMRANHRDFIKIASELRDICEDLKVLVAKHRNDDLSLLKEKIGTLKSIREEGRVQRRELYEASAFHLTNSMQGDLATRLVLMPDEVGRMGKFYGAITRYFEMQMGVYGHDIKGFIVHVLHLLRTFECGANDSGRLIADLNETIRNLTIGEEHHEEDWARISSHFAALKLSLAPRNTAPVLGK